MRAGDLLLGSLDTARRPATSSSSRRRNARARIRRAKRAGLSLGEATQAFLFFRARFAGSPGARRALGRHKRRRCSRADRALDRIILALIAGHQA
jgi:hypothetical protein